MFGNRNRQRHSSQRTQLSGSSSVLSNDDVTSLLEHLIWWVSDELSNLLGLDAAAALEMAQYTVTLSEEDMRCWEGNFFSPPVGFTEALFQKKAELGITAILLNNDNVTQTRASIQQSKFSSETPSHDQPEFQGSENDLVEEEMEFTVRGRSDTSQNSKKEEDENSEDREILQQIKLEEEEKLRKAREKRKAKRNLRKERKAAEIFQGYVKDSAVLEEPVAMESVTVEPAPTELQLNEGVDELKLEEIKVSSSGIPDLVSDQPCEKFAFSALPTFLYSIEYIARPIKSSPKVQLTPKENVDSSKLGDIKIVMWRNFLLVELRKLHSMKEIPPKKVQQQRAGSATSSSEKSQSATESESSTTCPNLAIEGDVRMLSAALCREWEENEQAKVVEPIYHKSFTLNWLRDPSRTQILIALCHGGYFAAAIFASGKPILHTTCHKYISRKKQGGRQSSHDNKGGSMTSAGALIRRQQEAKWREEIESILQGWRETIAQSAAFFIHAPGPQNASMIFFSDGPILKKDNRVFSIPFTTGRPSFTEVVEAFAKLTEISVYASRDPEHS